MTLVSSPCPVHLSSSGHFDEQEGTAKVTNF